MTQRWLDGFRMTDPDGSRPRYLWRALVKPSWWRWQAWLKWVRLVCRVKGHRFGARFGQTCCTRCDWYD